MRQRIFLWMMVLAVAIIFSAVTAYSGTISLPKTGQTNCYDSAGGGIACGTTGQDGDTLAGLDWPTPRFVLDECGTIDAPNDDVVTDNLTGLMWRRVTNVVDKTWQGALDWIDLVNTNGLCGNSDWRLPNVNELGSLINYGVADPAAYLTTAGFTGLDSNNNIYFWSSTTYFHYTPPTGVYVPDHAWVVSIRKAGTNHAGFYSSYNNVGVPNKDLTTATFSAGTLNVWPVRGGAGLLD